MRAILIDSTARTVTEIELDPNDTLSGMQKAVGGPIEVACDFRNNDTIFVNEDGLATLPRGYWFTIEGAHQPFLGNGIVCGFDPENGDTIDAVTPLNEVIGLVRFLWAEGEAFARHILGANYATPRTVE